MRKEELTTKKSTTERNDIMSKSGIFKRGQIWYWEDPLYGPKTRSDTMPIGEGGFRYSRYVLVIQSNETTNNGHIMVMPLSSKNHTPNDVKVVVSHVNDDKPGYVKTRYIFPVHPKMMKEYVCTLNDEDLKRVDAEIIRLLCPFITGVFTPSDIKEWFHIDMNAKQPDYDLGKNTLEIAVRNFISNHVHKTKLMTDIVTVSELKRAFDIFCINHVLPIEEDVIRFLDAFMKYTNSNSIGLTSWRAFDASILHMTEFRCIKIDPMLRPQLEFDFSLLDEDPDKFVEKSAGDVLPTSIPKADKDKKSRKGQQHTNWTTEERVKFLQRYIEVGKSQCAKEYGVSPSTAATYRNKWPSQLRELGYQITPDGKLTKDGVPMVNWEGQFPQVDAPPEQPDPVIDEVEINKAPTTANIGDAVSNVSNMITTFIKERNIYDFAYECSKGGSYSEREFYDRVSDQVYNSLLDFLRIEVLNKGRLKLPRMIDKDKMGTWKFLDIAVNNPNVSRAKTIQEMCYLVDRYYPPENKTYGKIRISSEWVKMLHARLTKYNIDQKYREAIVIHLADIVRYQ